MIFPLFVAICLVTVDSARATEKYERNIDSESRKQSTLRSPRDARSCKAASKRTCDPLSRYRTANGECNNLENPRWGSVMSCQGRLLPAHYIGTSGFRKSVYGSPLPGPRNLTLNLHYHSNSPSVTLTNLFGFFGQLLAHDLVESPTGQYDCCSGKKEKNPKCSPIRLPRDDPFYSNYNQTCLDVSRSDPCPGPTAASGRKQILNAVTCFIDASFVYGSDEKTSQAVRAKDGKGQLSVQKSEYGDLLPSSGKCRSPRSKKCQFKAGDDRVNQHTVLSSLQTIFLREHNNIARLLSDLNPTWDEDRLFQETRCIVAAEFQMIVYNEYLPIILGDDHMTRFQLQLSNQRTRYDPSENPSVLLEFSTAAYRFGHSVIHSLVARPTLRVTEGHAWLRDLFLRPYGLYEGHIGPLVEELTSRPAAQFDRYVNSDMLNFLLRKPGEDTGQDIASLDILRGRDHGLPPYVDLVRYCSEYVNGQATDIWDFDDLVAHGLTNRENAELLRKNYRGVKDVDAWTGLLMECPAGGGLVGPTTACIIAIQFRKLKFGDRFYFEHANQAGSFTDAQLRELRNTLLSRILCKNTVARYLPKYAMVFSHPQRNPLVDCSRVRDIDLSPWREEKGSV